LYRLDVRLQEKAVLRGLDGVEDSDVMSKKEVTGMGNCLHMSLINTLEGVSGHDDVHLVHKNCKSHLQCSLALLIS
jgi:hypothetical protein